MDCTQQHLQNPLRSERVMSSDSDAFLSRTFPCLHNHHHQPQQQISAGYHQCHQGPLVQPLPGQRQDAWQPHAHSQTAIAQDSMGVVGIATGIAVGSAGEGGSAGVGMVGAPAPDPAVEQVIQQCKQEVHGSLDNIAGLGFQGLRQPPRNFLFYGPPGTGKTMLVEKVAAEGGFSLLCLQPSTLLSKWSGESEKTLSAAFAAARQLQPCILFIDEVDSLAPQRGSTSSEDAASRRLLSELLLQLNRSATKPAHGSGATVLGGIYVLAATNRIQDCDVALLRRFHRRIHVPLPEAEDRAAFFRLMLGSSGLEHGIDLVNEQPGSDIALMVERSAGYSCSDLALVCKEAAMAPVREFLDAVCPPRHNHTAEPCAGLPQPLPAPQRPPDTLQHAPSNCRDVGEGLGNGPNTSANAEAGVGSNAPFCSALPDAHHCQKRALNLKGVRALSFSPHQHAPQTAADDRPKGCSLPTSGSGHPSPLQQGARRAELFAKKTGVCRGQGGSMHMFSDKHNFLGGFAFIGEGIPIGLGAAFQSKYRREVYGDDKADSVTCSFFGDGTCNIGQFYESLNMAGLYKLPHIFVVENNRWAIGMSHMRATSTTLGDQEPYIYKKGPLFDMPGVHVDGMDVLKERCAHVEGIRGHSLADPDEQRSKDEKAHYAARDPIPQLRKYLLEKGLATEAEIKAIDKRVEDEVEASVEFAESSPKPEKGQLLENVYPDPRGFGIGENGEYRYLQPGFGSGNAVVS
ncbi:thiamine diphosphate-binding protein [Dunaliella salina]|uniref:Thiamine diphosphate-binding protein n=1 Tax=Dunaliella salina TaxID=3046 RepID=A0ABQ7GEY4_DUNSA|nr:thiamine diphosphate-binding protein [Dunaliella salina]|eukprot:KAF5833160.1 thiamine diphosphate-binding protein [Dunaliella salina]